MPVPDMCSVYNLSDVSTEFFRCCNRKDVERACKVNRGNLDKL